MSDFQPYPNEPLDRRDPLAHAVRDVVIPDGLQSRLLDALREQQCQRRVSSSAVDRRWSTRRSWVAGVTSACLGGALAGYAWVRRELELDEVVTLATGWLDHQWHWQPIPSKAVADGGASLPRILRVPAQRQECFVSKLSYRTMAYDVSTPIPRQTGINAVLFKVATWRNMAAIPTAPPRVLAPTGRWQFAVWRNRSCLYVLAWTGPAPARRIRTLLDSREPTSLA